MVDKILYKRLPRVIKKNIKNYIAIILITILSITLFVGLFANYHYLKEDLKATYEASNVADTFVTVNKTYQSDINYLKDNKEEYNLYDIESRVYSDAYIKEKKVYLIAASDNNKISTPAKIHEGTKGVLLTKSLCDRLDIKVGDSVTLNLKIALKDIIDSEYVSSLLKNSLKEGKIDIYNDSSELNLDFKVTGIMNHAESCGNLAASSGIIYMNVNKLKNTIISTMKETYDLPSSISISFSGLIRNYNFNNQYIIKGGDLNKLRTYFSSNSKSNLKLITSLSLMPGNQSIEMDVEQAQKLCYVFPLVFYLVGILIIITTILKEVNKDRKSIGILYALGNSKEKIISYYIKLFLILIMVGVLIGAILGPIIIPRVMNIKYNLLYSIIKTKHRIIYFEYILCFIFIVFITILISFLAVNNVLKNKPKDILDNTISKKIKHRLFEKLAFFKKISFSLKISIRNIFNNKLRSLLVIIGVCGCISLLLCGFGITDTLNYGLDLELYEKISYDAEITFTKDTLNLEEFKNTYNDKIEYIEGFMYNVIVVEHNGAIIDTTMTVIDDNSLCYKINCNSEGITLSKKIAQNLGVNVGDKINILYSNNTYTLKVTNIINMFMSQGIYLKKGVAPFEVKDNRALLNLYDNVETNEFRELVEEECENINRINTTSSRIESANNAMSSLNIITITIKIFAILLALCVIYNLSELNFKEKIREISTLKVLGYGYKDISKMLVYEILILTFIGAILGIFLGYPLLYAVLSINEPSAISYIYKIDISSYIYSILITLGVSVVLNILISIKSIYVNMTESLKSET